MRQVEPMGEVKAEVQMVAEAADVFHQRTSLLVQSKHFSKQTA